MWPGKKLPGRMGGKTMTVQNAYVFKVGRAGGWAGGQAGTEAGLEAGLPSFLFPR